MLKTWTRRAGAVQCCDVFPNTKSPTTAPPSHCQLATKPQPLLLPLSKITWRGNNGKRNLLIECATVTNVSIYSLNNISPPTRWTKVSERDPDRDPTPPSRDTFPRPRLRVASTQFALTSRLLYIHTVLLTRQTTAHPAEIFSLAPTPTSLISASGSSALRVHSTVDPTFPLQQTIPAAHKLGCHHVCTAQGGLGNVFASVGFGGEIKIWKRSYSDSANEDWTLDWEITHDKSNGGDVWAVALSSNESYLACTTSDGRIHVWDLNARQKIESYETGAAGGGGAGSFAMAVDLSRDGKLTASGHQNGGVYVFNNDSGRLVYSLSGRSLLQP